MGGVWGDVCELLADAADSPVRFEWLREMWRFQRFVSAKRRTNFPVAGPFAGGVSVWGLNFTKRMYNIILERTSTFIQKMHARTPSVERGTLLYDWCCMDTAVLW